MLTFRSGILNLGLLTLCLYFLSCDKKEDVETEPSASVIQTPATYEFFRNGNSTVNYQGQIDRMNQLLEMKAYLLRAHGGETISSSVLLEQFENTSGNGGGNFSFSSSKQLKDKTFQLDVDWFEDLLKNCATASASSARAQNGVAGRLQRSNSNDILLDENGREFVQLFEKGIMGATFLNQIWNVYLSEEKTGDAVDNVTLETGSNYTALEHHFDEAFGYFGAPVDFSSSYEGNEAIFLASYSQEMDDFIGCNDLIMNAFKKGRAAIVANNAEVKNEQIQILYFQLERLAAAVAIHYVNEALTKTNDADRLHVLSECYAFVKALRYQHFEQRKLTQNEVDEMLNENLGDNLWETTTAGLNELKLKLSETYNLVNEKDLL